MFSFLNLDLSYRRYLNVYFNIISEAVVNFTTCRKVKPILLIFAPIKDFLDVCNVEQPGQT